MQLCRHRNTKASFSLKANMLLFKLMGVTIKRDFFFQSIQELPLPENFINNFLRTSWSLFFIAAILLEYKNCFHLFCNEKTEDQLSCFDYEMNSFDWGAQFQNYFLPYQAQGIETCKVETIT